MLPDAFSLSKRSFKKSKSLKDILMFKLLEELFLHEGKIAEMKTGEGKTLTITLAAYLNALTEKGVHIVTVNDYLAKRDCQDMGQIYKFLGLSSGYINNDQDDHDRKTKL